MGNATQLYTTIYWLCIIRMADNMRMDGYFSVRRIRYSSAGGSTLSEIASSPTHHESINQPLQTLQTVTSRDTSVRRRRQTFPKQTYCQQNCQLYIYISSSHSSLLVIHSPSTGVARNAHSLSVPNPALISEIANMVDFKAPAKEILATAPTVRRDGSPIKSDGWAHSTTASVQAVPPLWRLYHPGRL